MECTRPGTSAFFHHEASGRGLPHWRSSHWQEILWAENKSEILHFSEPDGRNGEFLPVFFPGGQFLLNPYCRSMEIPTATTATERMVRSYENRSTRSKMGFLLRRDLYEDIKYNKKNSPACLCCMQSGFHNSKNPGLV